MKSINYGYEIAIMNGKHMNLPFNLIVDELGKDRCELPTYKVMQDNLYIDFTIINGEINSILPSMVDISNSTLYKQGLELIIKFKKPLMMFYNHTISSFELFKIIELVNKKQYTINNAIILILSDNY